MNESTVKMQRKLIIKPYDRMVKDLVVDINDDMIILDPDYQRNYIWDNKKASLLIESILLNIPIPVIYASEDANGKWIVVDGLQRLYSLKRYYANELKLTGLETLPELNGKNYEGLSPEVRMQLDRGELRIIVLRNDSDPMIQFDIFMRLNTGAVKLNEQELRNCLYRGKLNDAIKNIVKTNPYIREMISEKKDRMLSNELILRYLAISSHWDKEVNEIVNYDGRIKNLINSYMERYKDADDDFINSIKCKIEAQMEKAYKVLGARAFKRNAKATKPNASLFDCILIGFEDYELTDLEEKKADISAALKELLLDPIFAAALDKATGNTTVINNRISTFRNRLGEIMTNASQG